MYILCHHTTDKVPQMTFLLRFFSMKILCKHIGHHWPSLVNILKRIMLNWNLCILISNLPKLDLKLIFDSEEDIIDMDNGLASKRRQMAVIQFSDVYARH